MIEKISFGLVVAIFFLAIVSVSSGVYALTVCTPQQGCTGISTSTAAQNGYNLYQVGVDSGNHPIYSFQANGGGSGGGLATSSPFSAGMIPIVVNPNTVQGTSSLFVTTSTGVKLGIGTSSPLMGIDVQDGIFGFQNWGTGPVLSNLNPNSIDSSVFIWYPQKGSIYAGESDVPVIISNIGGASAIFGWDNSASGYGSLISGNNNSSSAPYTFTGGRSNNNHGEFSIVYGESNTNGLGNWNVLLGSANDATAGNGSKQVLIGASNVAKGTQPTFMLGDSNLTNNDESVAIGQGNIATGFSSFAFGNTNNARGSLAYAIGQSVDAGGANAMGFGQSLNASGTLSITIGQGIDLSNRLTNNVTGSIMLGSSSTFPTMTITPNPTGSSSTIGSVGIGTSFPSSTLHVIGTIQQTNATNSLSLLNSTGQITAYAGSACSGSNQVTSISATGTVLCSAQGSGGSGSVSTSSALSDGQWVIAGGYNTIYSTSTVPASVFNASGTLVSVSNPSATGTVIIGVNPYLSAYTNNAGFLTTTAPYFGTISTSSNLTAGQWLVASAYNTAYSTSSIPALTFAASGTIMQVSNPSATGTVILGVSTNPTFNSTIINGLPTQSTSTALLFLGQSGFNANASGTYFGVNATSGFNGDLAVFQAASSSVFKVDKNGLVYTSSNLNQVSTSTGGNPSASITLSATNGTANTFMRSDAAPALSVAIAPVWTGAHQFTLQTTLASASSSNFEATGTLKVAGRTDLALASSTGLFSSGALQVAGQTTLASATSTNFQATNIIATNSIKINADNVSTSTGANPTATAWTAAVNGTANSFLRSDGAPALDTRVASSTVAVTMYDATTTQPYNYVLVTQPEFNLTLRSVNCSELIKAATTTLELFRATDISSTSTSQLILPTITCGNTATATTTFTSSTISAGTALWANVTSTAGTPKITTLRLYFTK